MTFEIDHAILRTFRSFSYCFISSDILSQISGHREYRVKLCVEFDFSNRSLSSCILSMIIGL